VRHAFTGVAAIHVALEDTIMNPWGRRGKAELEERIARRREREQVAGKLLAKVPSLGLLEIAIHEARPDGCLGDNQYIRRIVIEHAPALFEVPCSYPGCEDGGYDLTREILRALEELQVHFQGERHCEGRCRTVDCTRVLRYVATASYR